MNILNKTLLAAAIPLALTSPSSVLAADDIWEGMSERVSKEYNSKEWREVPDEVLVPGNRIKWNRLAKAALNLPEWMEFGLSQRTRYESVSHPWRNGQSSQTDAQVPMQSRVRLGFNQGPFWLMFEGQDSRTHLAGPNDFNGTTVTNKFDILQLFGSATLKNINDTGLRGDFHVGRMTLAVGSQRLVGRNGYRNTTGTFDGGHLAVGNDKDWRVRAFLTSPVQIETAAMDHSSTSRLFWGAVFESTQLPWLSGEAYYFGLNDKVDPNKTSTFSTFGVRGYQSPVKSAKLKKEDFGKVDYELETALQTGDKSSKGVDKGFFAYMAHAEVGYTFNAPWFPRFDGEYDYASGTSDPNGNTNNTFDRLNGLRRADMMQTGIFGAFFRSNIESGGTRLSVYPRDDVKLMLKHHVWFLAEAKDAFSGSNLNSDFKPLQDKTGNAGRFLGHDLEFVAQWKLKSNITLEAGYEHWFKGDYFKRLPASAGLPVGGDKDTDYFFVMSEFRF